MSITRVVNRYLPVIVFFLILSVGIGYALYRPLQYHTSFIVKLSPPLISNDKSSNEIIETSEQEEMINAFQYKYVEGNNGNSGKTNEVKGLKRVTVSPLKKDGNAIKIDLYVEDTTIIRRTESLVIEYLNTNSYVQKIIENKKQKMNFLVKLIADELLELEKVKNALIDNKPSWYNANNFDIYAIIIDLQSRKVDLEYQLNSLVGFEITVEALIPDKYFGISKKGVIILSFILAISAGIFTMLYLKKYQS